MNWCTRFFLSFTFPQVQAIPAIRIIRPNAACLMVMGAEEFGFLLGGVHEDFMHPDSRSADMGWRHALGENEITGFSV
jgi:hypothetical protein